MAEIDFFLMSTFLSSGFNTVQIVLQTFNKHRMNE